MADILKFIKQMTSNVSTPSVMEGKRQIATRLKFIASIAPNEKIDSLNLRIESPSIFTPIKRFLYGDSRNSTLSFFSSTIERTFEVIDAHIHSKNMSDRLFCANIISDLMASVNGLKAFQKTYEDDKLISCEISVLIESIEAKIYAIRSSHPDMFTIKKEFITQMEKQQHEDNRTLNPNERPDRPQTYRILNNDTENKYDKSNEINKLKTDWSGKHTVFDPSLDDISEDDEEKKL